MRNIKWQAGVCRLATTTHETLRTHCCNDQHDNHENNEEAKKTINKSKKKISKEHENQHMIEFTLPELLSLVSAVCEILSICKQYTF